MGSCIHLSACNSVLQLQSLSLFLLVNLDTVDWRRFLHAASQPWPIPSVTELLETLQRFQDVDIEGSGFVTPEQYDQVPVLYICPFKSL